MPAGLGDVRLLVDRAIVQMVVDGFELIRLERVEIGEALRVERRDYCLMVHANLPSNPAGHFWRNCRPPTTVDSSCDTRLLENPLASRGRKRQEA